MLRQFVSDMLKDMLPKKTKRQVFLVSFVALLRGATSYDREAFHKLNRVLHLAEKDEAEFGVSVILSKVIWNGKDSYEVCQDDVKTGSFNTDRISAIVSNILNVMPKWLLYGETEEIESDIAVILQERMEILGA